MDMPSSFGYWVRRRRKALDLTQGELARRIGCAEVSIQKIETDVRRPSRQIATLLAEHLRIPPGEQADFVASARGELAVDQLKDSTRPEPMVQVVVPDPLAAAPTRRRNLPPQPTALIGREKELAAIHAILRRADVRLLTLTGPGGIGKTRLAIAAAAEVVDDFAQGAYFVNLAPISDPALVVATIAQALGVTERGSQPLLERLKDELRDQELLLLLDNVEQVLDAAPQLAELLAGCPKLKLFVTSREVLHLYGEHEFAVPPLALPDRAQLPPLARLRQYEAVRLFIERAQAAKADFAVTTESAPAVVEICYRLDGLPLAIELAAARIKLFGPQALLSRLEHRLTLLTGGGRDRPARQQTIRGAIDWSYNLLSAAEQTLFRRLGAFVGGCTLEAAEAVLDDDRAGDPGDLTAYIPASAVLDGLASLVDQSLLKQAEGIDGEPRFVMLETIREYALERLQEAGESGQTQERHLAYYLTLVERANGQREGVALEQWYARFAVEHDNLQVARLWSRTVASGAEAELRLVAALRWFYLAMGYMSKARAWLEAALERRSGVAPAVQALALLGLGGLVSECGDHKRATNLYRESLALYQDIGDNDGIARVQHYIGYAARLQGLYEEARLYQEAALAYDRMTGDIKGVIWNLIMLGEVFAEQGDGQQARTYFHEALVHSQSLEDKEGHAWAVVCLGRVAHSEGEDEAAAALYQEGLGLFHELKYRYGIAEVLTDMGDVACAQDNREEALVCYRESLAVWQEIGSTYYIYKSLQGTAGVIGMQGQAALAARLFGAVEHLRELSGTPIAPVDRPKYDRFVDAMRIHLDGATFAAAWAEGQTMTLDDAVAYALVTPEATTDDSAAVSMTITDVPSLSPA